SPTIGQKGRREEVQEWRLEAVCPQAAVEAVIRAIRQAHSYEEPAFDVYPLQPKPSVRGEGRLGSLSQPVSLGELAQRIKARLSVPQLQMVGNSNRSVKKVAIVCGAGGGFVAD